jgi:hypothetical protein
LVVAGMMLAAWVAQAVTGQAAHNDELAEHGRRSISFGAYLISGDFWSATFENWESEFLQMGVYVLLTVWLRQKGSAESRPMTEDEDDLPLTPWMDQPAAWRRGGFVRWVYARSLSIAFFALFLAAFYGHLMGSWRRAIEVAEWHGEASPTLLAYAVNPSFWFESFQNWQSEFLAVFSLVVLSIFLRQKDSPQSKPVDAPHNQTGN